MTDAPARFPTGRGNHTSRTPGLAAKQDRASQPTGVYRMTINLADLAALALSWLDLGVQIGGGL